VEIKHFYIMAIAVNDANFKEIVINTGKPVVIDFWATWCGPCRAIAPIIDELAVEYEGKAIIAKCDVDTSSDLPTKYGIRNIPTLLFFKHGELVDKVVGAITKAEIVKRLESIIP